MRRPGGRQVLFAVLALALTSLFVRLGIWQLDRLVERRAENAWRAERLALPETRPGPAATPGELVWRRVRVAGRFDYAREIVLRGRSFEGAPGVHVVTPLRLPDRPAVLVLRGWLPAPDGRSADLEAGRPPGLEREAAVVRGIALPGGRRRTAPPPRVETIGGRQHPVLSVLDLEDAAAVLPYPVARVYVHATGMPTPADATRSPTPAGAEAPATAASLPRPVPPPVLDDGPHLVYAVQWFAFALITLGGAGAYLLRAG